MVHVKKWKCLRNLRKPATAVTSKIIASKWLEVSGFISFMIPIKSSECTRPWVFYTQIPTAHSFNLNTLLINNDRLQLKQKKMDEVGRHRPGEDIKWKKDKMFYSIKTWTPKKGKVAEPGFCGQAPGSGVIWQAATNTIINIFQW